MKKTIHQLFDEYMLESEYVRKLRPSTLRGYREAFRMLLKLVPDISLETITSHTITRFFQALDERERLSKGKLPIVGIKRSTARIYWTKLYSFLEWLRIQKQIAQNPLAGIRRPVTTWDDLKFLSRKEVEKICAALHSPDSKSLLLFKRNLAIFYTLIFCGVRRGELLALQLRDIDFERRVLTVRAETSKIPRTRRIPLHAHVVLYLKDYLKERKGYTTPYLFVSRQRDAGLTAVGLTELVEAVKRRSGVNFHLHQFRHTFAVNFLKTSNNVVKLKQLLGHSDIRMTLVYLRCLPADELRAEVEHMRLDDFV